MWWGGWQVILGPFMPVSKAPCPQQPLITYRQSASCFNGLEGPKEAQSGAYTRWGSTWLLLVPAQGQYCHHLSMKGINYQSFDNSYQKIRTLYMALEPPGAEDQAIEIGHERPKRHQHRGHLEVDKAMRLHFIVHHYFLCSVGLFLECLFFFTLL